MTHALRQVAGRGDRAPVTSWRFVAAMSLCGAIIAVLVALLQPGKYEATATLLLDSTEDFSALLGSSGLSDLLPPGALGLGSGRESGFSYLQLCKSTSVLGALLLLPDASAPGRRYFDTFAPRGGSLAARTEEAIRALGKCVSASYDPRSNVFRVTVRTSEPKASANLANEIVAGLKRFNSDVRTTRARDASSFVRARLEESRVALTQAEGRLAAFQESNVRFGNSPALVLQMKRLEREVRQDEELFSLLSRQLELSRIQEKKEAPVFSIVDDAVVPTKNTALSPLVAGALAAVFCGVAAFLFGFAGARPWTPFRPRRRFSGPTMETCLEER